jgi:D-3-phosphoglycerate dehydrogenase
MRILAYDPYISSARAGQMGVRLVPLDELLAESDFITVHLPKTSETLGLIGEEQLRKVKPTVRIVNAARGGIIDEKALQVALEEHRVAGAALDVFATEPCTDSPLFALDSVVVTPHLGASTQEAQENAGIAVARSVRLALAGELVPDAVNVSGGVIAQDVRPGIPLVERLGRVFTALAGGVPVQLDVEVRGEIAAEDVSVFRLAALKGLFADVVEDPVSYVNAPVLAAERGIDVRLITDELSPAFRNVITVRGCLADSTPLAVSGTLTGPKQVEKLVGIDDLELELPLADHLLVLRYDDRPGVVGAIGGLLGDAGVNIGSMQVARPEAGGQAVGVLTLDQAVPGAVLEQIVTRIGAVSGRRVDLT